MTMLDFTRCLEWDPKRCSPHPTPNCPLSPHPQQLGDPYPPSFCPTSKRVRVTFPQLRPYGRTEVKVHKIMCSTLVYKIEFCAMLKILLAFNAPTVHRSPKNACALPGAKKYKAHFPKSLPLLWTSDDSDSEASPLNFRIFRSAPLF